MELKTGKELEEELENISLEKAKEVIRFMSQTSKSLQDTEALYQKRKSELDEVYRKDNVSLREWARLREKEKRVAIEKSEFWEGKFRTVKQENNKLRNKLYKKEKQ